MYLKNVKDMENTVFLKTLLQWFFNKNCDVAQVAIVHHWCLLVHSGPITPVIHRDGGFLYNFHVFVGSKV
jgi:hypothetical protein